ncbi:hypothetical protein B7C62_17005 [Kitasatospora albolonga]|uniref:HTH gntR-type domain-containing protein n=1 Tax=Kitasatospora albolonga TaxID=68173 RepID=A0ABC8BVJ5_9ACTN|nr:hypothetical protein B7C62_17005 [Kitasatospora albolonga]
MTVTSEKSTSSADCYQELRTQLGLLQRTTRVVEFGPASDFSRVCETVRAIVAPWIPLAERRFGEAQGSPTASNRWRQAIDAARRVNGDPPRTEADFLDASSASRALLRMLMEAERPGPGVAEIAARLREGIAAEVYLPGSVLPAARITAEFGCSPASIVRVLLAMRDLESEGAVVLRADRARVAGRRAPVDRPGQIADWLRHLIKAGVYPPCMTLPALTVLSRALASAAVDVTRALGILEGEGVLIRRTGVRPRVRPALPFPVSPPPSVEALLTRLDVVAPSDADLSTYGIGEACRRAHTWWSHRMNPPQSALDSATGALTAAVAHLVPLVMAQHSDGYVDAVVRRAAVSALAPPPGPEARLWRTACLSAAVRDLLHLSEPPVTASAGARTACDHIPPCPSADSTDWEAARVVGRDDGVGSARLCNGSVLFEDGGGLLPDGKILQPPGLAHAGRAS